MSIDLENKKIFNGFGTIAVGANAVEIKVSEIAPPQEIGAAESSFTAGATLSKETKFPLDYYEALSFRGILLELNNNPKGNRKLTLQGWEINFEEYNDTSMFVWLSAVNFIINQYSAALAC